MATLQIKRRTSSPGNQAGAPTSLALAELAFNEVDNTLYIGRTTGGSTPLTVAPIGGSGAFLALSGTQTADGTYTFTGYNTFTSDTQFGAAPPNAAIYSNGNALFQSVLLDGELSVAQGTVVVNSTHGITVNGLTYIAPDGAISCAGNRTWLNADGSVSFYGDGSGAGVLIDTSGNLSANALTVSGLTTFQGTVNVGVDLFVGGGGGAYLGGDGGASFINTTVRGTLTVSNGIDNTLTVDPVGGANAVFKLANNASATVFDIWSDGSFNAAGGAFSVDGNGNIYGTGIFVGGGLAGLADDGSASFAGGLATINSVGHIAANSIDAGTVTSAGDLSVNNGTHWLYADGAASFGNGLVTFATNGDISLAGGQVSISNYGSAVFFPGQIQNLNTTLEADGSASFAGGNVVIDSSGNFTVNGYANFGNVFIDSNGITVGTASYLNADGSASFASGAVAISAAGVLTSGGEEVATKPYVDAIKQGLDIKDSVRAATTAAITLSGLQTIDNVVLAAGDRVLVKNQPVLNMGGANSTFNGIYVVAEGAWTRAEDADDNDKVSAGLFVFVEEGTVNADSGWVLTANEPISLGSTSLTFVQFSGAGQIDPGTGLSKSGNTLNVGTASASRIVVNADTIDLATAGTAGTYRSVTTDSYGRVTAGTNPTTFAGYGISDTSANLKAAITDETGSGSLVFATSPALVTPNIGAATATSISIADLGFANGAATWANVDAISFEERNLLNAAGVSVLNWSSGVTLGNYTTLSPSATTARTITFPDATGTVLLDSTVCAAVADCTIDGGTF